RANPRFPRELVSRRDGERRARRYGDVLLRPVEVRGLIAVRQSDELDRAALVRAGVAIAREIRLVSRRLVHGPVRDRTVREDDLVVRVAILAGVAGRASRCSGTAGARPTAAGVATTGPSVATACAGPPGTRRVCA